MKNKNYQNKLLILTIGILLVLPLFFISVSSFGENNVCCERMKNEGLWCQSVPLSACATTEINPLTNMAYRAVDTSCEMTTWCGEGTCVDSRRGICEPDVPQIVCNEAGGYWDQRPAEEIPTCQLGCCVLGDSGYLATQANCKKVTADQGLKINFRPDVTNELECLTSASFDDKGACVYEVPETLERTCKISTRGECSELETTGVDVWFHENKLCSAESLNTNCGPSEQTICVEGYNEVYFVDTCGNVANIYDASKKDDLNYWNEIVQRDEVTCDDGGGNANSPSCGLCDYYKGSVCKPYERGESVRPTYGDYICKDLGCEYEGKTYGHGEAWCAELPSTMNLTDPKRDGHYGLVDVVDFSGMIGAGNGMIEALSFFGNGFNPILNDLQIDPTKNNLPGSRYGVLRCYNGEITEELCDDERQKVCVQSEINGVSNAFCKLNRWQDCYSQPDQETCMNRESRDCYWEQGYYQEKFQPGSTEMPKSQAKYEEGYCVPLFSPGYDFWSNEGNGAAFCGQATIQCEYEITDGLFTSKNMENGEECVKTNGQIRTEWIQGMENRCMALGDCGPKKNYLGYDGETKIWYEKIKAGKEATVNYGTA